MGLKLITSFRSVIHVSWFETPVVFNQVTQLIAQLDFVKYDMVIVKHLGLFM
jgi:hypothetical protein